MNIQDYIQAVSIVVSALLTITSIVISVKALKQSQKSIELTENSILDANRPYVVIYRDYIQALSTVHEYLVVKNFGKTGATIDSLTFTPIITNDLDQKPIYENISGTFIAPNQTISTASAINAMARANLHNITAEIEYHDNNQSYKESFILNDDLLRDLILPKSKPSKNKSLEEVIVKATEEILRRGL